MELTQKEMQEQLEVLEAKKAAAVFAQQYEMAARYRDSAHEMIKKLEELVNKTAGTSHVQP